MSVTVGLIGLTHPHSPAYLRTLDALDAVGGVVLCDPNAGARAEGMRACRKARAAVADERALLDHREVSIALIALPADQTPAAITRAAEAGKHILCEKPCARAARDLAPALALLGKHRVTFAVCYIWRAHPAALQMRELVRAGALGRLLSGELRMVTSQVRLRDPAHWLFKRAVAGGGVLAWLGCHWLDLLRFLTGQEVIRVHAVVDTVSGEAIDVEDVAAASLGLSGGGLISLHAGYLLPFGRSGYEGATFDHYIALRGTEGALELQRAGDVYQVTLRSTAGEWRTPSEHTYRYALPPGPAYGGAPGLRFFEACLRAAHGEGDPPASALDALRVLEILDGIYESASTGRLVTVATSLS